MNKLSVLDLDVHGKRVLVRADFNVPLDEQGQITDFLRIEESLPTIKFLTAHGAKTILISHLGRPKGKVVEKLRLTPVQKALEANLKMPIRKMDSCVGPEVKAAVDQLKNGDILLLENVRFHAEEEANDEAFTKQLAELADYYVNDAFGTAHRAHASTCAIASHFKKAAAGLLMAKEIGFLSKAIRAPEHPFVALLGGAKVSDKIGVIKHLADKVDIFIIGGAMAYTFLAAFGHEVGDSKVEADKLDLARQIEAELKKYRCKLLLPVDHIIAQEFKSDIPTRITEGVDIPSGWMGLDIGPKTIIRFEEAIRGAKLVLWNGPMGVFEMAEYRKGTFEIARFLANTEAVTIVGGGDSAAAVHRSGVAHKINHVSTGGGASLEFLEGKVLPGVAALTRKTARIPIIAGNWKMNNGIAEAKTLINELINQADGIANVDKVVAPPFIALPSVARRIKGTSITLAAQNMHYEERGAYTGEVSPAMLKEVGCKYVILGHSERRTYFGETNELINKKILAAFKHGLIPIVCVGETEDQRETGQAQQVITEQVYGCFANLSQEQMGRVIVAYEPLWAIGTGKTATPEQAQGVHAQIRQLLEDKFGDEVAQAVRIQYGGSVKPENIAELIAQPDIDGALVGGASLKASSFSQLIAKSENT